MTRQCKGEDCEDDMTDRHVSAKYCLDCSKDNATMRSRAGAAKKKAAGVKNKPKKKVITSSQYD